MTECQKSYLHQAGNRRWRLCNFGCIRNKSLVHDASRQQMLAIKEAPFASFNPWDLASAEEETADEGSVAQCCPWSALVQATVKPGLLLKPVPGVVQAGRRPWGICVCVPWGLVMWIRKSGHLLQLKIAPFTLYIHVLHGLCIISAVCSLAPMLVHCSCKTEDLTALD